MIPVYKGRSRQYGYGLGSLFKRVFRMAAPILMPVAKATLKTVKRVAARQGIGAINDLMSGKKPKDVLKSRGKQALKTVGKSALRNLSDTFAPIKPTRPRPRGHSVKRRRTARRERDIFD